MRPMTEDEQEARMKAAMDAYLRGEWQDIEEIIAELEVECER